MSRKLVCSLVSLSGWRSNSGAVCPVGGASSVSIDDQSLEEQPSSVQASTLTSYLPTNRKQKQGTNRTLTWRCHIEKADELTCFESYGFTHNMCTQK